MMSAICFVHESSSYTGETLQFGALRGTESSVAHLAIALAARGHDVTVYNGVREPSDQNGVSWRPIGMRFDTDADIAISVNKARLFDSMRAPVKVLWSHNRTSFSRLIKRDGFLALIRHRPHAVLLGAYHDSKVSKWLPFRSRHILSHGLDPIFFARARWSEVPPRRAIFTSEPYRGFDWLSKIWPAVCEGGLPAELHIFASASAAMAKAELPGCVFRGKVDRRKLRDELAKARVMLLPGHEDETFCLAAAEATAAGVPIITLGVGCLRERVEHDVNGFVAKNRDEFIEFTQLILNNDDVWRRLNANCVADKSVTSWDSCAIAWEKAFGLGNSQGVHGLNHFGYALTADGH